MGMTSYAVYEHVKDGRSSLRKAFSKSISRAPTLIVLAVVSVIVSMVAGSLRNSRSRRRGGVLLSMLGNVLGDVLKEGWEVASRFLVPVAVIGGLGIVDSFKKAFELVSKNLVFAGAGLIGIRVVTGIVSFLGFIFSLVAGYALFTLASPFNIWLGIGIGVLFAFTSISFFTALDQFVKTSYYTLLYAYLEEGLEHGSGTAAPTPLNTVYGY